MALHFHCLPTQLDADQINDYLYLVKQEHNTPSDSYFKFTVYSLRYVFRMEGLQDKRIELPALRREGKLSVVLSKPEVKKLLAAPVLLKHRVLLATLYGCGLRNFELCNLRLSDLDFAKQVTPHTLRHTFATHLFEDGLDMVSIKDLLGHACIDTTMVYLHVAQSGRKKPFSPLDTLYC